MELGMCPSSNGSGRGGISAAARRLLTLAAMVGSSVPWLGPLFLACASEVESAEVLVLVGRGDGS